MPAANGAVLVSPIDAAMREITIEMDRLAQHIGNGKMPERVTVEIEFDARTGMPKAVELHPSWRRHIQGGAIPMRAPAVVANGRR
jgi:hypothetical protein